MSNIENKSGRSLTKPYYLDLPVAIGMLFTGVVLLGLRVVAAIIWDLLRRLQ